MRRLILAALAALSALTAALPAAALPPGLLRVIAPGGGPVQQVDPFWPLSTPDSGCWTFKVRNARTYAPATNPERVGFMRQGFDDTGKPVQRVEYLTLTQRVRHSYPMWSAGAGVRNFVGDRVAASDYPYATDRPLDAGVAMRCNSYSPQPVINWVMLAREVVGDTIHAEIAAGHRNAQQNRELAFVQIRATDKNGLTVTSSPIALETASANPYDRHPLDLYQVDLDISTLADGIITLNGKGCPFVGDANSCIDSASSSEIRGFSPRYYLKDPTRASNPYKVVVAAVADAPDGVGTPTSSCAVDQDLATAKAAPCDTYANAMNRIQAVLGSTTNGIDGAVVYVDDGTSYVFGAPTNNLTQKVGCVTVTRLPTSTSRASVVISGGSAAVSAKFATGGSLTSPVPTGCVRFKDITLKRNGAQTLLSGSSSPNLDVFFEGATLDTNGQTGSLLANSNAHWWFNGLDFAGTYTGGLSPNQAELRMIRGLNVDLNGGGLELYNLAASDITRPGTLASFSGRSASNTLMSAFYLKSPTSSSVISNGNSSVAPVGFAMLQGVCEWTTTTAGHCFAMSNDNAIFGNTHTILHNMTFVGWQAYGRENRFYDDGLTYRVTKYQSIVGNIEVAPHTKGDDFHGTTSGEATLCGGVCTDTPWRTGQFANLHGVGNRGNFIMFAPNGGALGDNQTFLYPGLGTIINTTSQYVRNDPLFIDNKGTKSVFEATGTGSTTTAQGGAGGGDYDISGGSPAAGINPVPVRPRDFEGETRPTSADSAGAFKPGAAANDNAPARISDGTWRWAV